MNHVDTRILLRMDDKKIFIFSAEINFKFKFILKSFEFQWIKKKKSNHDFCLNTSELTGVWKKNNFPTIFAGMCIYSRWQSKKKHFLKFLQRPYFKIFFTLITDPFPTRVQPRAISRCKRARALSLPPTSSVKFQAHWVNTGKQNGSHLFTNMRFVVLVVNKVVSFSFSRFLLLLAGGWEFRVWKKCSGKVRLFG